MATRGFRLRTLRRATVVASVTLTACTLPTVEPLDIPADVTQYIPADIDMSEVNRDINGCYFYTYGASLFTVKDDNGDPVCRPDTNA